MKYLEFQFKTNPCTETVNDILSAVLGEVGFDSFTENEGGINAYIQAEFFDEETLENTLKYFPLENTSISYTWQEAEDKNWNEEWEKNYFQPIIIDDKCVIHSTFHQNIPQLEYDILINPQMSFGTGHHETTSLIISELLKMDLENKSLLDMGCGTSILAILARMRGAKPITAIDIDTWCVENSKENIALNNITDITVELGNAGLIKERGPFDIIIANINRNILLNDMLHYVESLNPGGELYMSGFYVEDVEAIKEKAESLGLVFQYYKEKNKWAAVKLICD
ncbi:50S ribosomal protein L11 methyltransferase [Bacteroides sp. 519]|uniref:50S ribosomal protein L11 methyltransferase n=1 Tax=Bacteroides sp. 519 TaxID=2302937 RepID=UPI0013D05BB3|nr:50S ribosomal protein L11 methyltransferase [Bacteroides sp. 519]NDV59392.1 50S ribosomal protein L11 methyltransferase [Bacteroides sp. 519]